MLSRLT